MNRQEAIDEMHYESFEVRDFINKIYDDFESRICDSCRYYNGDTCYLHEVYHEDVGVLYPKMDKNDGCNKYEKAKNDK